MRMALSSSFILVDPILLTEVKRYNICEIRLSDFKILLRTNKVTSALWCRSSFGASGVSMSVPSNFSCSRGMV